MLTLNSTLQTAQDSVSRHPLLEIKYNIPTEDGIPFDGQLLVTDTENDNLIEAIKSSNGRVYGVYRSGNYTIKFFYTDIQVQIQAEKWVFVTLYTGDPSYVIEYIALCEIENRHLGIMYIENQSGTLHLKRIVVDIFGNIISSGDIANWSDSLTTNGISVVVKA